MNPAMLAPVTPVPRTKSPEAFRTISEVAVELDVSQHVLRFWEGRFTQVRPVKRAGGRRYYRPEDIDLLRGIRALLYSDGFTIKGVQKILREKGLRHVAQVGRDSVAPAAPRLRVIETKEPVAEPTHARAAIAVLERAHAPEGDDDLFSRDKAGELAEVERAVLETLLAELLQLKAKLRRAKRA